MVSRGGQIIEAGHLNSGQVIVGSAGDPQLVTMNGDITIDDLGATTIGAGRVQNGMLADNSVTSNKIQDGQVMTADIADANVTTIKIADSNVTNGKLAADAVTTDKISDGTIVNADINAAAQIDATKLIDGSVSNTELGYINTLTSNAQTQLDNIGTQIIGINTLADGKIYVGDATNTAQEVFVTGDITMTNTGLTTISNNAVTTGKILDGTILNGDIADGTIDLTQKVMNVLPIANGGTNSGTALVNGRVMVSRGSQIVEAGVMNNGQVIVGSTGVEPQIVTLGGDATINTTGSLTLANTGVANATYGDATHVGRFTVDSKGRLTFAENVVVTGTSPIGSALTNNHIWLGNNLDQAAEAILSGDITTTNTGVTTISNDAVTSAKILNGTILNEDIANTTIDLTQKVMNVLPIANGGTNSGTALVNGRVMVSRAGQIVEAGHLNTGQLIVGSAGDPQLVTMNGDITIDDLGATTIGAGKVQNGMLADNSVTSNKIQDGQVQTADIADANVTNTKLSANAVTTDKILDGTIVNADINAAAQIDATKLIDGSVSNTELGYINTLTSNAQTQLDNIGTQIIGINTLADGKIYVGDATNTAQEVFVTGDITMTNTGLTTISNNAVTTGKILDGTILNGDIADGTIDLTQKVMNVLPIVNGGTN
jgi:GH24 family phage-related lysozyme (muramidase)